MDFNYNYSVRGADEFLYTQDTVLCDVCFLIFNDVVNSIPTTSYLNWVSVTARSDIEVEKFRRRVNDDTKDS
jgi:hypothetical protein